MSKICMVNHFGIPKKVLENLSVDSFGMETEGKKALWGPGRRPVRILHFVLSGSGFFNDHPVKAGQGFYITPNCLHEYHADERDPWVYLWVTFGGSTAADLCKLIRMDPRGIFDFRQGEKINALRERIAIANDSGEIISFSEAQEYFFALHGQCLTDSTAWESGSARTVEKAKQFIQANYHRSIQIRDVAEHLCVSANYLTNLFLKVGEKSPKKFLSELRITKACALLRDESIPVNEIAVSVGYTDALQFSRFFSKHTGISPTDYRKRKHSFSCSNENVVF